MSARAEGEAANAGGGIGETHGAPPLTRRLLLAMPPGHERSRLVEMFAALAVEVVAAGEPAELRHALQDAAADLVIVVDPPGARRPDVVSGLPPAAADVPIVLLTAADAMASMAALARIHRLLAGPERAGAAAPAPAPATAPGSPRCRVRLDPFLGRSEAIVRLAADARIALESESPVLIEGETGSGKGVLAEWLHRHGPRGQQPFIDLNCAGFSRELMDSELFGHDRGAFTGAVHAKPGLLEVAEGGTLFLDEVGDMELPIQAKLLKVIEEKRFRRIGENRERRANVRIIAATHRDLLQLVREGRFREDLYYRIGVLSLRIPPLRRRREDLSLLVASILHLLAADLRRPVPGISRETARILRERAWPGNLRELRNTLERAILAAGDGPIEPHHLSPVEPESAPRGPEVAGGTISEIERAHIERVLAEERHVERAARRLGMARSTLYQKLRLLGIRLPR